MKRTLTSDELINEIAEVLREGDEEFIAGIANQVLVPEVTYVEDSMFEQVIDDDEDDKFVCETCKQIKDIEDSVKPDGKKGDIICATCLIKELKEQVAHLESLLPHINDRHEYSGTIEVIGRLEGQIEALEQEL